MKNQSKLFWLGVLSGVGLLIYGMRMLVSGIKMGMATPTEEQRVEDYALAEMVYAEVRERGEPDYMAEFYRAETTDLSQQETRLARSMTLLGVLYTLGGAVITWSWLWLVQYALS